MITEPMRVCDLIAELQKCDPMRFVCADGVYIVGVTVRDWVILETAEPL